MKKVIIALSFIVATTNIASAQSDMSVHKNAATALTFTENNSSPTNQHAIQQHLSQAGINIEKNIHSGTAFSQLDSHEKAAIALSFTQNNTSPTTLSSIQSHLEKSKNFKPNQAKSATLFADMNEHEKAIVMLNLNKNSSSEYIQNEIKNHLKALNWFLYKPYYIHDNNMAFTSLLTLKIKPIILYSLSINLMN